MSFNIDCVRDAWNAKNREARRLARAARLAAGESYDSIDNDTMEYYSYVKEVWSDYVIVEGEGQRKSNQFSKVPFTVDDKQNVTFGTPVAVRQEYVTLSGEGSDLLWVNPDGPAVDRLKLLVEGA